MRHFPLATTLLIALFVALSWRAAADPTAAPHAGASAAQASSAMAPATFEGVTPCADCPGISLTVTLKSDGTYTSHRVYLERSTSVDEHGRWSYNAQRARLTLTPTKGAPQFFSVTFSRTLHMLDTKGNPLPQHGNDTLSQVEPNSLSLAGTGWVLVELGGKPFPYSEPNPVTMVFDAAGDRVFGSGGCNRYNGPYVEEGDRLTFGVLASTKMMCIHMNGEDAYFAMLEKVASFVRTGEKLNEKLTLYDKNGKALAVLAYQQ